MKMYTPRVFMGVVFTMIIWWTAQIGNNGQFPFYYYIGVLSIFLIHQASYPTIVGCMYGSRPTGGSVVLHYS